MPADERDIYSISSMKLNSEKKHQPSCTDKHETFNRAVLDSCSLKHWEKNCHACKHSVQCSTEITIDCIILCVIKWLKTQNLFVVTTSHNTENQLQKQTHVSSGEKQTDWAANNPFYTAQKTTPSNCFATYVFVRQNIGVGDGRGGVGGHVPP